MKKHQTSFPLLLVLLSLTACEKWIEVGTPITELASANVFEDEQTAISAMSGLYSRMMQSNLQLANSGLTLYTGMTADELLNSVSGPNDQFSRNNLNANNTTVASLWASAYNYIYQANAIIEGLRESKHVRLLVKNQLMGEALFVRAFCHFHLANLFGNVPNIATANYQIAMGIAPSEKEKLYGYVINDLNDAMPLLTNDYPSTERTRPNLATLQAFLSRVYLYHRSYEKAASYATAVIQNNAYSLNADLQKVFLANSNETIFQLMPVSTTVNTWDGSLFIPSSTGVVPPYRISNSLFNAIDNNDARKTAWIKANRANGIDYHYPYKYKVRNGQQKTEYQVVFRLAEQYLIRAEAYMEMDRVKEAIADINKIRTRAGLGVIASQTQKEEVRILIAQERRIELFAEGGHRWFDLNRTGQIQTVMKQEKGNDWAATDALFPIPLVEINKNVLLRQNLGY